MRRRHRNRYSNNVRLLYLINIACVLMLSIGFSALQNTLEINDINATVKPEFDIRITDISIDSSTGNAISSHEEYNVKTITSGINLPNSNSSITYDVEITNIGNVEMGILNITGLPSNLTYTLSDYNLKDILCDDNNQTMCKLGSVSTIKITIGYAQNGYNSSNTNYSIALNFSFKRVFSITYNGFSNDLTLPDTILEGESKTITFNNDTGIPYDVAVTSATGSYSSPTLTLSDATGNITISRYYKITYVLNGGTNSANNPDKFLANSSINIANPTYPGNNFEGWYEYSDFSGTVVTNISNRNSDITLYAKWSIDATSYTITYVLNGGTQANNQITSYYSSTPETILSPTNTHDATFDGWYENSSFTGTQITSTSQLSGSVTLHAKWIGDIANTTFSTTNNRFTANNVNNLTTQNFITTTYQYTQNTAHTNITSVGLYITYTSSNKKCTLTCQIASNSPGYTTRTTTITLNTNQNNATAQGTITLTTAIQSGSNYTISCPSRSGNGNDKIKINGFAFIINP